MKSSASRRRCLRRNTRGAPRRASAPSAKSICTLPLANFGLTAVAGAPPYPGVKFQGFEKSTTDKTKIIELLNQSFDYAEKSIADMSDADMSKPRNFQGFNTVGAVVFHIVAHAHEHLGQSIAYARMNGVVPPWTAAAQQKMQQRPPPIDGRFSGPIQEAEPPQRIFRIVRIAPGRYTDSALASASLLSRAATGASEWPSPNYADPPAPAPSQGKGIWFGNHCFSEPEILPCSVASAQFRPLRDPGARSRPAIRACCA